MSIYHGKMFVWKSIRMQNNYYYSFLDGRCPKDYPFAYLSGNYCCKTNQEKENGYPGLIPPNTCDGIGFSIESTCCKDNKYLKCPSTKCVTRPEGKL